MLSVEKAPLIAGVNCTFKCHGFSEVTQSASDELYLLLSVFALCGRGVSRNYGTALELQECVAAYQCRILVAPEPKKRCTQPFVWCPLSKFNFSDCDWLDPKTGDNPLVGKSLAERAGASIRKIRERTRRDLEMLNSVVHLPARCQSESASHRTCKAQFLVPVETHQNCIESQVARRVPPITNSCRQLKRSLIHDPGRLPDSYRLSARLATIPSSRCFLANRARQSRSSDQAARSTCLPRFTTALRSSGRSARAALLKWAASKTHNRCNCILASAQVSPIAYKPLTAAQRTL